MPHGIHSGKARTGRGDHTVSFNSCIFRKAEWCGPDRNMIYSCYAESETIRYEGQKKGGFVVGRASFGKISAVEGIRLTPTMQERAADAERKGLSAEEYRQTIARSYRKP
jgi:hypothetical protein